LNQHLPTPQHLNKMEVILADIEIKYSLDFDRYVLKKGQNWLSLNVTLFDMFLSLIRTYKHDSVTLQSDFTPFSRIEFVRLFSGIDIKLFNCSKNYIATMKFNHQEVEMIFNSLSLIQEMTLKHKKVSIPVPFGKSATANDEKSMCGKEMKVLKPQNADPTTQEHACRSPSPTKELISTPTTSNASTRAPKKQSRKRPLARDTQPLVKFPKLDFDDVICEEFMKENMM